MAMPVFIIALLCTSVVTSLLVSQLVPFNAFTYFVQGAKAAKHKVSLPDQVVPPNNGNSVVSSIPNNSPTGCINYNPATRTITVSCTTPARLTDVNNALHDNSILAKQTSDGVWLLSANLVIGKGAIFHIDPTDTKWLKINSRVIGGSIAAYSVVIHGSLNVDSVKITGWDQLKNSYPLSNGSRTGRGTYIFGTPRPSIYVDYNATGTSNITNSEIAYLGYETGKHKGGSGLSYYGGDGSVIRNNNIHNVYFGFYSIGLSHVVIENNIVSNSGHYGLDPHTGTHDLIIRNNTVFNNNGSGIICSLNCYNILIENNKVHDNAGDGIDFSRFTYNSVAKNNIVYDEPKGIFITRSHHNQVYNNSVSNSVDGIKVGSGSNFNKVYENSIINSKSHAIFVDNGSSSNTFYENKIVGNTKPAQKIEQDPTSKNNVFYSNHISLSNISSPQTKKPKLQ
jgi:parallel beta-helix repeat protein